MVATPNILVVDDEPVVTKSCRRILSAKGYRVETAEDGAEGMRRAVREDFDVVITDLRMPGLDGMDLVRAVRQTRPDTGIVVITGYGSIHSAVEAITLGATDYIEKPFTPDQLALAVDKAMPQRPAAAAVEADMVRAALKCVVESPRLDGQVLRDGSAALSGLALSSQAKAAIVSGDIVWLEKECGELTAPQRQWLLRRQEAERW